MEDTENKGIAPAYPLVDGLEMCIDYDHVSIPISRFEELLRAEAQLDIVRRSYQSNKGYRLDDMLSIIFGPRPEEGGDGAQ